MCERPSFMGALVEGSRGGTIGYTEMSIQGQVATVTVSTIGGFTGREFKIVTTTLADGRIEESYWDMVGCHICGNPPPPFTNYQINWAK